MTLHTPKIAGVSGRPVIRQLDERRVDIEELSMKSPSLEDAYLHLVGREEAAV